MQKDIESIASSLSKIRKNRRVRLASWAIVILMIVVLFYKVSRERDYTETTKLYTKGGCYYAVNQEAFDEMRHYAKSKNSDGLKALIRDRQIITMPSGLEVRIVNCYPSLEGGFAKIEPIQATHEAVR